MTGSGSWELKKERVSGKAEMITLILEIGKQIKLTGMARIIGPTATDTMANGKEVSSMAKELISLKMETLTSANINSIIQTVKVATFGAHPTLSMKENLSKD